MKYLLFTMLMTLSLACSNSTPTYPSPSGSGGKGDVGKADAGIKLDAGDAAVSGGGGARGTTSNAGAASSSSTVAAIGGLAMAGGVTGVTASGGVTAKGGTGGPRDAGPVVPVDAPADMSVDSARDSADTAWSGQVAPPDASPEGDAESPSSDPVLSAMRRANDFFLAKWPDATADIVTDKTRPSNLWTRAVYFEGLMALYAIEPDNARKASLYEYAVRWGESPSHPWTLTYTEASSMTSNADNQCCGQTYIDLYLIEKKPERIATIKANIDNMVSRGTANAWTWIDAIQMAMPVFARLGVIESDPRYFDAMWALYTNARTQQGGGLRNPADGLWWRDLHFTPGGGTQQRMTASLHNAMPGSSSDAYIVAPNGKDLTWSRGNGWVMAALVRVLDWLPAGDSHRATYVADFQTMAASLLPLQRSDGFWNESLLDPTHCASIGQPGQDGPETSGTALFAYGLAWGIRQGLLDRATYGAALDKAWNGLVTVALQTDGRLGYVQSTGDRPCTDTGALGASKLANFDDYGVGAFLLAGSEIHRL
jgi:rhamnogalacturonyl hydrolase YesR